MEIIDVYICFAIVIPIFMLIFICKGQARRILIFALLGAYIGVVSGEINVFISAKLKGYITYSILTKNLAPIIEEILKGLPVILYAKFSKKRTNQSICEIAVACGIGFALIENMNYIISHATSMSSYMAFARGIGAGIMHGFCTYIVAIGVCIALKNPRIKTPVVIATICTASVNHSIYNTLVTSKYEKVGIMFPILSLVFLVLIQRRYRRLFKEKA